MKKFINRVRKLWRWIPAILCMAVIFYLSHQPASTLNHYLPYFQKIIPRMDSFNGGHFVAYFILALTVYFALGAKYTNWKGRLITIVICMIYGITDEIHQLFVEGRTAELSDVRNDTIGAAAAMAITAIPLFHRFYVRWFHAKNY